MLENKQVKVYNYIKQPSRREQMLKKIMEIISKYVEVPAGSYSEETNIFDLGVDSLRMLRIIMDVEEAFGVRFEDEEIVDIRTANDIEKNILDKFE